MVNKSQALSASRRALGEGDANGAPGRPKRRRLAPETREQEILDGAVRYFSERGFAGGMRDLAVRLGISHALLFRYFPSKDALVDRVYDRMFLSRWDDAWDALLADGSVPFSERLTAFYRQYLRVIDSPEWTRTFVYAGLAGLSLNRRYLELIRERVVAPIAIEMSRPQARPDGAEGALAEAMEASWGLHGEIFYVAVRRWIYGLDVATPNDELVGLIVRKFLEGAPVALRADH